MRQRQGIHFAAAASPEAAQSNPDSIHTMSKSKELTAPIIIPAELNLAQITTYWSQLAAWNQQHSSAVEELYWSYCQDRRKEVTVPGFLHFCSYTFLECRAGSDLRRSLQAERKTQQASRPVHVSHPTDSAAARNNN